MSLLKDIYEFKRGEVEAARQKRSLESVRAGSSVADAPRGFRRALAEVSGLALIAEVKKASPSKGLIRPDFDPGQVAGAYRKGGAHCLSVLTDERYFQGSAENLRIAREVSGLPCLRKDFVLDPYQLYEARAWDADAILLIVAMLEDSELHDLYCLAKDLGMDALVEVHTEAEAERALKIGADLIGVNNRDLADFTTSIEVSQRLLPLISPHALAVSESALESRRELDIVEEAGAKAVLIGTTFCASPDIESKVREVMGW